MWIVETKDEVKQYSNLSSETSMELMLLSRYPKARIFKSVEECHNEFGALAFAEEWVDGELTKEQRPKIDESGELVLDSDNNPIMEEVEVPTKKLQSAGNTWEFIEPNVVVKDKNGDILATFLFEEVK